MKSKKIITQEEFLEIRDSLKKAGKIIVMCHGVYDLLHYGHIEHLKEAKSYGDILIVSVTAAEFVNKGPDRPVFDDAQRTGFLESIECVDYVILSHEATALTNINVIKPDIFVKGQEFQDGTDGITGNVAKEIEAVKKAGGKVKFTQGEVHSSSKLLNTYFGALPDGVLEFSRTIIDKYGNNVYSQIEDTVNAFKNKRVLVIGDIIIDDYIFCQPQGLTSKDAILSTRFNSDESYLGGALAIARHIAGFCDKVAFISMMGLEDNIFEEISSCVQDNVELKIIRDENFITPVKRRYLKHHPQRGDYEKLFSINYVNDDRNIVNIDYTAFHNLITDIIENYDLIVLCDYGHGLIDSKAIEIIQDKSRFLALNCQTNSSNYGMNIITKYTKADTFTLDEKELALAVREYNIDKTEKLEQLRRDLDAKVAWLTIGAKGAMVKEKDAAAMTVPALTLSVADTVGAGDAFFALSSLCAASDVPVDIGTLISNAAAAIKTHVIGNKSSIKKRDLLKFIKTVINV